jgi:hypothetical protein
MGGTATPLQGIMAHTRVRVMMLRPMAASSSAQAPRRPYMWEKAACGYHVSAEL